MIKSFLIIISFSTLLFSSQQVILVVADDFNTSKAKLECFEDGKILFKKIDVNLGKNGLGWGLGEIDIQENSQEVKKYEGDKKAPIGIFKLTNIFGYAKKSNFKLPYLHTSKSLICVDDSNSNFYNHIIETDGNQKSYEHMKRSDNQYKLGITVAHNQEGKAKRGSCIFLHVEKYAGAPTAGCTSMRYSDIQKIAKWLDKKKNPILIQIPKSSSDRILKLYPQLQSSQLLH